MATIQTITRKFIFNGNDLNDIQGFSPEQIKDHYSAFYPEIVNAQISNKGINENGELIYEFNLKVGTNG